MCKPAQMRGRQRLRERHDQRHDLTVVEATAPHEQCVEATTRRVVSDDNVDIWVKAEDVAHRHNMLAPSRAPDRRFPAQPAKGLLATVQGPEHDTRTIRGGESLPRPTRAKRREDVVPRHMQRIEHRRMTPKIQATLQHLSTAPAGPRTATYPRCVDMVWADRVPYLAAWNRQRELHAARVADEIPDTVLLLEHDPIYTAGKRTEAWERPLPGPGVPEVLDVDRGGRITWHGPGQLTGYPIVKLADPVDVVAYVRRLEDALIGVCAAFDVIGTRVDGRSGVWVDADAATGRPSRKVAAIGIRVARAVTMHGFALNCDCDLLSFAAIVPCGITDAGVTSLSAETGRNISVSDVLPVVERELRRALPQTAALLS